VEEVWSRGLGAQAGAEGELEPVAVDESLTTLLFDRAARPVAVAPPAPVIAPPAPVIAPPAPVIAERRERERLPEPGDHARAANADAAAERTAALVGW
jgi:hypothetical protein